MAHLPSDDGRPPLAAVAVAGLAVGAGLVLVALLAFDNGNDEAAATGTTTLASTTTSTTMPDDSPEWFDPREVIVGAAALIPIELTVQPGEVALAFDIELLGPVPPPPPDADVSDGEPRLLLPALWTLVTSEGEIPGTVLGLTERRVAFDVPEGLTREDVLSIRLDAYRVPVPFAIDVPLDRENPVPVAITSDISLAIDTVLEQRDNSIVVIEMITDDALLISDLQISGVGPEWVRSSSSLLAARNWTLDFRGEVLPSVLPIRAQGLLWPLIDDPRVIDISGLGL